MRRLFGETSEQILQTFEQNTREIQTQLETGFGKVDRLDGKVDRLDDKIDELRQLLARPALPSLEELLQPIEFVAELADYGSRFVQGTRDWVFDDLELWRNASGAGRCRVLLGGPGFGKTAIVAELCRRHRGRPVVLAVHLCRHDDVAKRDPRRMMRSLAYQLAQALPEYRELLEADLKQLAAQLDKADSNTLFSVLFLQPLAKVKAPNSRGLLLIIIDALDEAEHDLKNEMLTVIAREFSKLPDWIGVLLTGRPELRVQEKLRRLHPQELDADAHAADCDKDARLFLRSILESRVPAAQLDRDIETVAQKAGRVFLYLHFVRQRIQEAGPTVTVDALPDGLADEYEMFFERLCPDGRLERDMLRVLQAVLTAAKPLHIKEELPVLSGVPRSREILERLSQLFPVHDDKRLYIFHKSIADWLTGAAPFDDRDDESDYFVDRSDGHRMMADACIRVLKQAQSWAGNYAVRFAMQHCASASMWDAFGTLGSDLSLLSRRCEISDGAQLVLDYELADGTSAEAAVGPFARLLGKEMPIVSTQPDAVFQLALQQPDDSAPYKAWLKGKPYAQRFITWHNKPTQVDPCILSMQFQDGVMGFAQLPGRRYAVAVGSQEGPRKVEVRDARNGDLIDEFECKATCIAAGGGLFAVGCKDGTLKVWDAGVISTQIAFLSPKLTPPAFLCSNTGSQRGEAERAPATVRRVNQRREVLAGWFQDCLMRG